MTRTSFLAAAACAVLASALNSVQAHSDLQYNGRPLGKFDFCSFCPIGSFPRPPEYPKELGPEDVSPYLAKQRWTVRDLFRFSLAMPLTEDDHERVKDFSPTTCGRFDMNGPVVELPASATFGYKLAVHKGPAEIYVDGKRTWHVESFKADGKAIPRSVLNCDKESCEVRWYMINTERINYRGYFQLYVQCFRVKGNGRPATAIAGGDGGGNATTPTSTSSQPAASPNPSVRPSTTPSSHRPPHPTPTAEVDNDDDDALDCEEEEGEDVDDDELDCDPVPGDDDDDELDCDPVPGDDDADELDCDPVVEKSSRSAFDFSELKN